MRAAVLTVSDGVASGTREDASGAVLAERPTPGLDEAMREVSRRASPHGLLSRGASGITGRTLIVNFPGSPKACAECFDAIAAALPHGVELLTERPTEHP